MNYAYDLSANCNVSASWIADMHGGAMSKGAVWAPSHAVRLPVVARHQLRCGGYNPSIVSMGEALLVSARVPRRGMHETFLGRWDVASSQLVDSAIVHVPAPLARGLLSCGSQDIRLFVLNGVLHAVACVGLGRIRPGTPMRQAVVRIADGAFTHAWLQPGASLEKNWMPCVVRSDDGAERLRLVYSPRPLIVLDYDEGSHRVRQNVDKAAHKASGSILRGGSQLVPYRDGWLAVLHQLHVVGPRKVYAHAFAFFNHELTRVRVGRMFYFNITGIEFAAGLAVHAGRYFVSYGVADRQAWLAEVSADTIEAFLGNGKVKARARPVVAAAPRAPERHARRAAHLKPNAVLIPPWG
jgi:hypothetical protein